MQLGFDLLDTRVRMSKPGRIAQVAPALNEILCAIDSCDRLSEVIEPDDFHYVSSMVSSATEKLTDAMELLELVALKLYLSTDTDANQSQA